MIPLNVPLSPLAPTVSVGAPPATVSTVPLPTRALRVSLFPFRSKVPLLVTSPPTVPPGRALATPSCSVPEAMVVPPAYVFAADNVSGPFSTVTVPPPVMGATLLPLALLKVRAALSRTRPVPMAPPASTSTVPALITVPPL